MRDGPRSEFGPSWLGSSGLWFSAAVASFFVPFLLNWGVIGVGDFDQFATFNQIALWWYALGDWQGTWSPFLCGGSTLQGNPQIPLFHPNLLLYILFGPVKGMGVSLVLWCLVGATGMWLLLRDLKVDRRVATWISTAWVVNGFFIGQLGTMHILYTACYGLPWGFWLNRRIVRGEGGWAVAALPFFVAALSWSNHHFLAYAFPFIPLHFGLELAAHRRHGLQRGLAYAAGLALGLGMTALYFLPSWNWNRQFPRFKPPEFFHPLDLLQMLVFPLQWIPFPRDHDIHEYILVVGPVLLGLAVLGALRANKEGTWPVLITSAVATLTCVGTFEGLGLPAVGPFDALRAFVPGYQAIRVPSRFFVVGMVGLFVCAALGWQHGLRARGWSPRFNWWILGLGLVPLLLFNLAYFQWSLFSEVRGLSGKQGPVQVSDSWAWAEPGHRFTMMQVLEPNVGVLDCYEALEVPQASQLRRDAGFVLDASFDPDIERRSWALFTVSRGEASEAGRVRLNFNHHRDWRVEASDGPADVVSTSRQPLTIELAPGTHWVRVVHRDPFWPLGLAVSSVSFVLAVLFGGLCIAKPQWGWGRQQQPPDEVGTGRPA